MQLFPSNFHPKRKQICRGQPTFSFGGGSAGRQRITPSLISLSNVIMNLRTVMMKMSKQMRTVNMMLVMTTSPNIQHKIKIKKLILEEPPVLSPQKRFFFTWLTGSRYKTQQSVPSSATKMKWFNILTFSARASGPLSTKTVLLSLPLLWPGPA